MLSIQQIDYIIALAEEKHFVRASERCFVTQPTLSMQIKKAEDALDNLIFDRSVTPIALTPFGEKLLPVLYDLKVDYAKINVIKEQAKGVYSERLKIAIIPTISAYMIPDLFLQWKNEFDNIEVQIEEQKTEQIIENLKANQIDLGIMAGPYNEQKVRTIPLYREEIKAYVPEIKGKVIETDDLEELHPWLLTQGNCLRTQMVNFCGIGRSELSDWNYEGGNIELLTKMVDMHAGYTLVPEYYSIHNTKGLRVIESKNGDRPAREIIGVFNKRNYKTESIEKILRTIQLKYAKQGKQENIRVLSWN